MSAETILITGGTGGIASEIARAIACPGRTIAINFRSSAERAEALASEIRSRGAEAMTIQADVTIEDEVARMFAMIHHQSGRLDALINNAAPALTECNFLKVKWEDFQGQLEVQVKGTLLCSQNALKMMKPQEKGHIITILSSYVLGGATPAFSSYITAKHAQLGLMHCLGAEAVRWGVRVNMVSPSLTRTDLVACMPDRLFEIAAEQHPSGRLCTPADVAGVVRFLLSKDADYINLANLPVNGGSVG